MPNTGLGAPIEGEALAGVKLDEVESAIVGFYQAEGIESPGVTPADFAKAIAVTRSRRTTALRKAVLGFLLLAGLALIGGCLSQVGKPWEKPTTTGMDPVSYTHLTLPTIYSV